MLNRSRKVMIRLLPAVRSRRGDLSATRGKNLARQAIASLSVLFCALLAVGPCLAQPSPSSLKVGTLVPFVGRWGETGREWSRGMMDGARLLNQRGGVYGRRLEVILIDDTFQTVDTVAAFRKLNEVDDILLLSLYSLETTMTLLPHIQFTRIPTLVSALPSHLAAPSAYPYIFSAVPTPLDLAKIGLFFLSENSGIKVRKPKIAFVGSSDYLDQHFLEEAKLYARSLGIDVVPDVVFTDLSLSKQGADRFTDQTDSILSSIARSNPDYAYLSLTSREAASLLKESTKRGAKTKWICNWKAFDENLTPYNGVLGVQPVSFFGEDVPAMAAVKEAHQRWHPYDTHTLSYVEGWAATQVIAEALRRSLPENLLSRERMRDSLETFRNYITGGLLPPLTITSEDHRPSTESRILVVKDGKISIQSSFVSIPRERKPQR